MQVKKENIAIVLVRPKYGGNVGAVARCAKNMGFENIVVVSPNHFSPDEMKQMSTHAAADLVDAIRYFDTLEEAFGTFQYIVGTTARIGAVRGPVITPRNMAERLVDISQTNSVALLFGSEDRGLTNEELRWCQLVVSIPTGDFKSLNLSHAVMILCYELFLLDYDVRSFTPKMASALELEGMYGQVKELLQRIGFLNPENPDYWMTHIRRFLSRTKLQSREVKIIRGICRQLRWDREKNRKNS